MMINEQLSSRAHFDIVAPEKMLLHLLKGSTLDDGFVHALADLDQLFAAVLLVGARQIRTGDLCAVQHGVRLLHRLNVRMPLAGQNPCYLCEGKGEVNKHTGRSFAM